MRDEFRGNFSKDAFNKDKGFSRILIQQGRVLLDSDLNELQDLVTYYLRTLAKDIIGPRGGLKDDIRKIDSFSIDITKDETDITIAPGHYYVDGILCINNKPGQEPQAGPAAINYKDQDGYISDQNILVHSDGITPLEAKKDYLIYLDVWERSISYIQDDALLETALGIGDADTAVRSKVVWQVKAWTDADKQVNCDSTPWDEWDNNRGLLMAKIVQPEGDTTNCIVSQGVHITVPKNLLFRVEVHHPGIAGGPDPATFKWSCINGSADFKISSIVRSVETVGKKKDPVDVATVTLESPLDNRHLSLEVGDIVEIIDDIYILARQAFPLWQVHSIEADSNQVILTRKQPGYAESAGSDITKNPLLRRWDQKLGPSSGLLELSDDNAAIIKEGDSTVDDKDSWLSLGMGVAIRFQKSKNAGAPSKYRTGDYWLIPVRALAGVNWPEALPPHGIEHHYAPLAIVTLDSEGKISKENDCRFIFESSAHPPLPT
ncbi:MAG TPA: DUF6519 domain-containing protein [Methanotrichaceae archaeon]|nr:DUF6519 domain-containing protein [Methanotrichaceae archaeon]